MILIQNTQKVELIELENLSTITNFHENRKIILHKLPYGINEFSELSLSYIRNNRIIINSDFLTDKQKEIILDIYKEDTIYMNELELRFSTQ